MGTIFKHNGQILQCKDLQKKLKRMRLSEDMIEIIQDNIPNDILEKTFVELTRNTKSEDDDYRMHYYIFENSNGNYLWGIGTKDVSYYNKNFGLDVSDYKLIDECIGSIPLKYQKWNPETKTGRKDVN